VNVKSALEANTKTTETMEPRMSPFDKPTEFVEAAAVSGAAPGGDRSDATLAKSAAMRVEVVAEVGVDDLGLAKRSASYASNRQDGVDQRQQLRDIVAIRAGQDDADRNAVRVYEDVVFGLGRARLVGFGPVIGPPQRLARTKNRQPRMRNRSGHIPAACRRSTEFCQSGIQVQRGRAESS
jgi:hypothetical protein